MEFSTMTISSHSRNGPTVSFFFQEQRPGSQRKKNTAFAEGRCPSPLSLKWTGPQGDVRREGKTKQTKKKGRERRRRKGEGKAAGRRETECYKSCPMVFYVHPSVCLPGAYSSPSPARSRSRVPFIFLCCYFHSPLLPCLLRQ